MSSEIEMIGDNAQNIEGCLDTHQTNDTKVEGPEQQSWPKKEKQFYNKIEEYETALAQDKIKIGALNKELLALTEERDQLKINNAKLEKQLAKSSLHGLKQQENNSNDMVTRARSVIFEKTKVCKNQELQIDALTQQVKSLKEIASISKDMLDIRNIEVQQLQEKVNCMELKFKAEKDRHTLMNTKLERMMQLNEELKTEYQSQLGLFVELQKAYSKRLNMENQQTTEENKQEET